MNAARRVLQYLKGTASNGILLPATNDLQVHAYYDSNCGACPLAIRSLTGYFVIVEGLLVSWKTKKQVTSP